MYIYICASRQAGGLKHTIVNTVIYVKLDLSLPMNFYDKRIPLPEV